jgi:hypothetical protein
MTPARPRARLAACLTVALALAGCAGGDFGRLPQSMASDDMHNWLAYRATGQQVSSLPLTADEHLLRDLAYQLIAQPYQRERYDAVVHEYGYTTPYPRGTYNLDDYANHLLGKWRRAPESAYARLIDDVRDDITRLPNVFTAAARVRDLDEKRRRSLFLVSTVSDAEHTQALQRIRENAAIIDWVHESLRNRARSYRIALERLVAAAPDPQAVEVERAINMLNARAAFYRRHLPAPWARERSLADAR